MAYLSSLSLNGFRNYDSASTTDLNNQFIVLIGDNGAGKTNCLEGVSLLSPGRGLRGATVNDCQSQTCATPWSVSGKITDHDGDVTHLGVGRNPGNPSKKIIRADGDTIKNQSDLGDILRTMWLTPQMDGLFLQSSSERRRFLDRLVATFDPAHVGRMTRMEKATRERLNLLKQAHEKNMNPDTTWLCGLENIMAETSIAISIARSETIQKLQQIIDNDFFKNFPIAQLDLHGDLESAITNKSALEAEDYTREKFETMRHVDGQIGRTHFGITRTDMVATYTEKNVDAAQCSTGEQKALLTTIILAHAQMVTKRYGVPPVLLFDEVCAHFDATKRNSLFEILNDFGGQIWLTGQDEAAFSSIKNKQSITIKNNLLSPCE
jgi:DNA replication and repair protein RecF